MKVIRCLALICAVNICLLIPAHLCPAGTAAFSSSRDHVFLLGDQLIDIDLASRRALPLPLNLGAEILALASAPGGLLIATSRSVWQMDYSSHQPAWLCNLPAGMEWPDGAFDPKSKNIVVCSFPADNQARDYNLFVLTPGSHELEPVRNRRLENIEAPVFDCDGTLYFAAEGDIWRGAIDAEEGDFSLTGVRIIPIATRETYNGTPSQMGAQELALTSKCIYAAVRRMGGSGWGQTVRFNIPRGTKESDEQSEEDDVISELKDRVSIYLDALSSFCGLGDNNGVNSFVCSSMDGQEVFYATVGTYPGISSYGGRQFWLGENGGDPQPINIDFSAVSR